MEQMEIIKGGGGGGRKEGKGSCLPVDTASCLILLWLVAKSASLVHFHATTPVLQGRFRVGVRCSYLRCFSISSGSRGPERMREFTRS
jgi:hypothetical protein